MHVLLTGATGVLGAEVARALADRTDLTCLIRRRALELDGVEQVRGDLTEPDLGLAAPELRELVASTDVVVHSGAMTAFGTDLENQRRVNVEGTQRVLDLVAASGARLVHVSTAFVARIQAFADAEIGDVRTPLSYLRSKVEAESMVLGSGLDPVVVRPSVVVGDSRTGEIRQFQGWHATCGSIITGRVPFLPAAQESLVDCVPVDHAARAITALTLASDVGGEFWLTAGSSAPTLGQSVDRCLDIARESGLAPPRPRLLPLETVERLVLPAFADGAPRTMRRRMLEGVELMRLFASDDEFPSRWPVERGAPAPTVEELDRACRQSLRFWCERQGVGARAAVA